MRIGRISIVFVILIAGFALCGGGYASWSETLNITGTVETGNLEVKFVCVAAADNEICCDKDVGEVEAYIEDDGDRIVLNVSNAYPGYKVYVVFKVKNVGTIPARITHVIIDNPNPDAIVINISERLLTWGVLYPDSFLESRIGILVQGVADAATPNTTYHFTVILNIEQWNVP